MPPGPLSGLAGDRLTEPYEVRLSTGAARGYKKLPAPNRARIAKSLEEIAAATAGAGRISGKKVRTIQGTADSFHRLRVGDYRVMYDNIPADRVLLVLGIAHLNDLERWLRSR